MSCGLQWWIFVGLFSSSVISLLSKLSSYYTDEMGEAPNKWNALASLTDDAIVEILHRLPVRSLFYCKCVCRSQNRLIKDYNNHKMLPWTLAGFFYDFDQGHRCYTSVNRQHPTLEFLPFTLNNVAISDCCNSRILCWCRGANGSYRYVICNPTTKKFKELLPSIYSIGEARLGFDPIASSHFHLIQYVEDSES